MALGVQIATAYVNIVPSFEGVHAAISKGLSGAGAGKAGEAAGGEAGGGFASSFGDHVRSIAKVATGIVAGLAGGTVLKSGLQRLTTIQDATAALNVQFGDTTKTADFMGQILATVQGTPFNLDQFATAGKNMVAFGVGADKVPTYLKSIGEAAAASGNGSEAVNVMTDAFGKMATAGQVSNDSVNSLELEGVPAMKILANHFGITTVAMKDMIANGEVPATEGMQVLSDGIMNGTDGIAGVTVKFGGSMAALRETFSGAFGGMKAAVARLGANMLKPWLDDMTHAMQGATSLMDDGGKTLAERSQALRDKVVPALTDLWSGLSMDDDTRGHLTGDESLMTRFGAGIRNAFDFIKPYLQDIGGAIKTVVSGDFDPSQWGHPIGEDSPIVSALLTIREKINDAAGFVRTLVSGDFDPSQWSAGTSEDSPIVDKAFVIRDRLKEIAVFVRTLVTGDFDPSAWGAGGVGEDSPIVDKAMLLREKISGVVDWIKGAWNNVSGVITGAYQSLSGGDSSKFYDSLGGAAQQTKDLVGGVMDLASHLPSLSDVLTVAGGLFKFIADHMDTVIKWLPVIIAGFVAYKVVQSAVNVVNLANIPIHAAMVVSQLALASSNRALAVAMGGTRVTALGQFLQNVRTAASWVASTAALIAHKVAVVAVNIATKAFAIAQWLLNAAMDANPVMIVVLALAALAAAVIWAWNNVDWFRNAVLTAWEWIQNAAQFAWENILKPVFAAIMVGVQAVGDFFSWLWASVIQPVWNAISAAIQWAWTVIIQPLWEAIKVAIGVLGDFFSWLYAAVIKPVWDAISAAIQWAWTVIIQPLWEGMKLDIGVLGAVFQWLYDNVINPVWQAISTAIQWAWTVIIQPLWEGMKLDIGVLGQVFQWLYDSVVKPVWDAIGTAIQWSWDNVIKPAFDLLKTGLQGVGDFFSTIAGGIGTAWAKIKEWAAVPINWVIEHIWNDGIVKIWNLITGWIPGVDITLGTLDSIAVDSSGPNTSVATGSSTFGLASGGVIPGYSHSDTWNMKLSGGEGILNPEAVVGLGPDFVHAANRHFGGARVAGAYGGNRMGDDGMPHFFLGGLWDAVGNIASGVSGFVGSVVGDIADAASFMSNFMTSPLDTIMGMLGSGTTDSMTQQGGASSFGKAIMTLPGSIIGGVISRIKGFLGLQDDGKGGAPPAPTITGGLNLSQDPSSFGWVHAGAMSPYSWNGVNAGSVATGTNPLWDGLLNQMGPVIPGGITNLGGYEDKQNVNNPAALSFHSYGLAMDVNAPENPNGAPGYGRSGPYVIPGPEAAAAAGRWGMIWGGDFTGTPDPMHFEIHVSPGQIGMAAANTLGQVSVGAGVEQWRSTVLQALGITGQSAGLADIVLHQMDTESSGNPAAINLTDSNAVRGTPSKGLLQVIDPTFSSYALAPFNTNIYDPLSNIIAAIRYTIGAYGGVAAGMQGHAYDTGGWLMPNGVGVNLSSAPEPLLTPGQWNIAEQAINQAVGGQNVSIRVFIGETELTDMVRVQVDGAVDKEAHLLQVAGGQA